MIIDELHVLPGVPKADDELAVERGVKLYKTTVAQLSDAAGADLKILVVNCGAISSLPKTVNNSAITGDMVVIESALGTPAAQTGDWTVNTSAGSLTISGTISGSTTLTLYLAKSR